MSAHLFTVFVPGYFCRREITRTLRRSTFIATLHSPMFKTKVIRTVGVRGPDGWQEEFRAWMDSKPIQRQFVEVYS